MVRTYQTFSGFSGDIKNFLFLKILKGLLQLNYYEKHHKFYGQARFDLLDLSLDGGVEVSESGSGVAVEDVGFDIFPVVVDKAVSLVQETVFHHVVGTLKKGK